MKVKELQEKLANCDPEGEVWVLTKVEAEAEVMHCEGANCILEDVYLVLDDEPTAVASMRSRQRRGLAPDGLKYATFPILITGPNE